MYPHLSESDLIQSLQNTRNFHLGIEKGWPQWLTHDPAKLLTEKKFIVCGSTCRSEIRVLAKTANVIAIVDDFLAKKGEKIFGIDVIDSDTWADRARKDASIVSCILTPAPRGYQHFTKIATQWNLQTLTPLQYLHLLKIANVDKQGETGRFFWYGEEFFSRTLARLDHLLDFTRHLADPYSRISWLCVLAYRMTLNPFYLEACAVGHGFEKFALNSYSTNREFFDFSDSEVYVDGGTFTGYTITGFLNAVNNQFKHIHAFEPSTENNQKIRQLLRNIAENSLPPIIPKITLHQKGLWNKNTELAFNPSQIVDAFGEQHIVQPSSAHLVESGIIGHIYNNEEENHVSIKVPVTTIDDATNRLATFIKLEIEGSELQALQGACETIAKNRPKMAISIYHKPEDLETLTDFVQKTEQGYKMGFRQHNPLVPDAMVLYCY